MKKALATRIKITKTGKLIRRPMGIDHFRSRKTKRQVVQGRKSAGVHISDRNAILKEFHRTARYR